MNKLNFFVLLVGSGFLSGINTPIKGAEQFLPGILFGIIMSIWFSLKEHKQFKSIFLWLISSTISFYIAINIAVSILMSQKESLNIFDNNFFPFALPFLGAGLVGAFLISISTKLLINNLSSKQIILMTVTGCITSLPFSVMLFTPKYDIVPFIIWQVTIGLLLCSFTEKNK